MTSQRITYVESEAVDEVFSTPCPACDAQPDELCMVQTDIPGRRAVTIGLLSNKGAHTARVLETTVLDSAWQDSDDPDLLARWNERNDTEERGTVMGPDRSWLAIRHTSGAVEYFLTDITPGRPCPPRMAATFVRNPAAWGAE